MKILTTLKLSLALIILTLFNSGSLISQQFYISEVDPTDFPTVKAGFVARTANDIPFQNLVVDDFDVFENGISMDNTLQVNCITEEKNPEVSIVMVLDQSNSMNFIDSASGEKRWEWVKEGAEKFINTIKFEGRTAIAMTTFGDRVFLECPFTNDRQRLLDSLESIKVGGATRYEPPFVDYQYGADTLLSKRPVDMRRIVVFLTDGNPNWPPDVDSIVTELNKVNAQVYAITLTMPMNPYLEQISDATGGKSFAVFTKEQLAQIYELIALDIQTKQYCYLTWEAPYGCNDLSRERDVTIKFKRISQPAQKRQYIAPPLSIASVDLSEKILSFGDPSPGTPVEKTLTIKAEVAPFDVTGYEVIPNNYFSVVDWGGDPPPFTLDTGQTRDITVEFIQQAPKDYRQAELVFQGAPCPPQVTLVGGYEQVIIVKPAEDDIYSTCDLINITWGGVKETTPVDLYYSDDGGSTWNEIVKAAVGLNYSWKPPAAGVNYKIKAEVAEIQDYFWAKRAGGIDEDKAYSVAVTDDDMYVYNCGFFNGEADFSNNDTLVSAGGNDIFLAKYLAQGELVWARRAGTSSANDTAMGVAVDVAGNAYITGVCFYGSDFGNIRPGFDMQGVPYCFLAKYPADGGTPAVKLIGAVGVYTDFKARGLRVRLSNDSVYVQGEYSGSVELPGGFSLPYPQFDRRFTAVYDENLSLRKLLKGGPNYDDYSSDEDTDSKGNLYKTGPFAGTYKFDESLQLNSVGKNDAYIYKYGTLPSSDYTTGIFQVNAPELVFNPTQIDFGDCSLGGGCGDLYEGLIANTGTIPVRIIEANMVGNDPQDFSVTSNIVNELLTPGEKLNVELSLTPTATGPRMARLEIVPDCGDPIYLDLSGMGICNAIVKTPIDFDKVNVGTPKEMDVESIFKNPNSVLVRITPVVEGTNASEFTVTDLDGNPVSTIPVDGKDSVALKVTFTPQAAGTRTAEINYNMPGGCENPVSELIGEGVATDFPVYPLDFKLVRVQAPKDSFLVVENQTGLATIITDVALENSSSVFEIHFAGSEISVPAGDTVRIPVTFTPAAEQVYQNSVAVSFKNLNDPVTADITGTGYLPQLEVNVLCGDPIKKGQSKVTQLILTNNSTQNETLVEDIQITAGQADFQWLSGTPPGQFTIPPNGGQQTFDLNFSPQGSGIRDVTFTIRHDAIEGPPEDAITTEDFDLACEALGITVNNIVDFGTELVCNTSDPYEIEIRNNGGNTPITITGYNFINNTDDAFKITTFDEITVPPGGSRSIYVAFAPRQEITYDATLVLENSINEDLQIQLTGDGYIVKYSTTPDYIEREPSVVQKMKIPVYAKIADLTPDELDELTLQIIFDEKMLEFQPNSINNSLQNWSWDTPVPVEAGVYEVSGSGTLPVPFDGKLFDAEFREFLADVEKSNIEFLPVQGDCSIENQFGAEVQLTGICFLDGRLIELINVEYQMKEPRPNPASNSTILEFNVALEANTRIELVNSLGELQEVLIDKVLKPGSYQLTIPTANLPSGAYLLRLKSGPYFDSKTLMIAK